MTDITDPNALDHPSPSDDLAGNGLESRGTKRPRMQAGGDDDDDDDEKGGRERRKIEIKFIQDKSRRHITFSKRKAGIMKKVIQSPSATPIIPADYHSSLGIRTVRPHWYSSPSSCRFRDRSRLHIHDTKAPASCHKTGGQKSHPSKRLLRSHRLPSCLQYAAR